MNKPLKIVAWIAGTLVALLLLAAIILPLVVDPNDFREEIAGAVESRTGRALVIEGDLELSVFPWLGVDIGRARLANAPFAGDQPMVAIEGASVGVRLLPLLAGRLEVRRVTLDGLQLALYRGPEGTNWDSFIGDEAGGEAAAPEAGSGSAPPTGEIGGIRLKNARLSYVDKVEGIQLEASLGEFSTGRIGLEGGAATVADLGLETMTFDLEDASRGSFRGTLRGAAAERLDADPESPSARVIRVEGLELSGAGGELGDFVVKLERMQAASADATPAAEDIEVSGLLLDYDGAEGQAKAVLEKLAAASLSAPEGNATLSRLTLRGARVETGGGLGEWRAAVDSLETASVAAKPGAAEIGESSLTGLELARGGEGGFEFGAQKLQTGGVMADPARPRVAGLELRDGRYAYALEGQGRLEGTIPELTVGTLEPGATAPVKGRVEGRFGEPATRFDARLEGRASVDGSAVTVSGLGLDLSLSGESVPGGTQEGRIAWQRLALDSEAQTLGLEGLEARLAGLTLEAQASGQQVLDDPRVTGSLRTGEFSPRKLMQTLGIEPPETTDPAVLERASLEGQFAYTTERFSLPELTATLDESRLTGRFSYAPGETAVIRSSLRVDGIDIDRYLAPAGDEGEEKGGEGDETATELPTEALRGLDVEADLNLGWVRVAGVRMTDVKARALVKEGVLTVDPLSGGLYEGRVNGRVTLDGSGQVPRVTLEQRLESVKIGPLVTDLAEVSRIQGTANLSLNATGSGATSTELLKALAGQMSFDIQDGVLSGINLVHALQSASALLKGNAVPEKTSQDTQFQAFGGSARFREGRMVNEDLKVTASALQVTGQGSVGLVEHDVDYRVSATVPRGDAAAQAGLGDLAGSTVPVRVTGTLSSLSVRPDLSGVVRNQAESLLRRKLGLDKEEAAAPESGTGATGEEAQQAAPEQAPAEEKPKSVEDALKDEAKKKLKDLFGG